jgi:hypothetical protein
MICNVNQKTPISSFSSYFNASHISQAPSALHSSGHFRPRWPQLRRWLRSSASSAAGRFLAPWDVRLGAGESGEEIVQWKNIGKLVKIGKKHGRQERIESNISE